VSSPEQAIPGKYYKSGRMIYLTTGDGGDPGEKGHIYQLRIYRIIAIRHFIPLFLLSVILLFPPRLNEPLTSTSQTFFISKIYKEFYKKIFKDHSDFSSCKIIIFTMVMTILVFADFKNLHLFHGYPNHPNIKTGMVLFCDYYQISGLIDLDNRYLPGQIYPPLAILLNVNLVGRQLIEKHNATNPGKGMSWQSFQTDNFSYAKAAFIVFLIIVCLLLMFYENLKEKNVIIKASFILCIFCTEAFQRVIMSGNFIGLCALLSAFFIFNYKHKRHFMRESALIALALAAGLKLYPAFLGLLVVYEKDYRAVLRLLLYGVLSFVIPLLYLNSNFFLENLSIFINNLRRESQYAVPLYNWRVLAFRGEEVNFWKLLVLQGEEINLKIDKFLRFANYVLAALALFTNYCQNKNWKRVLQICMTFMLIVPRTWLYFSIYVMIPMILYFNEEETNWYDLLYLALFLALFWPSNFGSVIINQVFLRAIASQIIIFLLLYESSCCFIHRFVRRKHIDKLTVIAAA
jgi:hypothetical protein